MPEKTGLVERFAELRKAGLSIHDAWNIMAMDILAEAGLVRGQHLDIPPARGEESGRIPVMEAKLTKIIRLDPEDDDKIQRKVQREGEEASQSRRDPPTQSSIMRRLIKRGLYEEERDEHSRK